MSKRLPFYQFALLDPARYLEVTGEDGIPTEIPTIESWTLAAPTVAYNDANAAKAFIEDHITAYDEYKITDKLAEGLTYDSAQAYYLDETTNEWVEITKDVTIENSGQEVVVTDIKNENAIGKRIRVVIHAKCDPKEFVNADGSPKDTNDGPATVETFHNGEPRSGASFDSPTLRKTATIISIEKTVTPAAVSAGDTVTFTITVNNEGHIATERSTSVKDELSDGLTFVSATPAPAAQSGQTLTWTELSLDAANENGPGKRYITVTATVEDVKGPLTNVSSAWDPADPDHNSEDKPATGTSTKDGIQGSGTEGEATVIVRPKLGDDETYGLKNQPQTGKCPVTPGSGAIPAIGAYTLVDPETGEGATSVTVPEGTYTINPDTGEVTFVPEPDFVGDPTPVTVKVTDENGLSDTGTYQPHVKDDEETDTVSRTIHYVYSTDGSEASADVEQTATFTRTATGIDPKTGEITYGEWELTENKLNSVESPEIDGWTPSSDEVAGFDSLSYADKDSVKDVTVVYSPEPPTGATKRTYGGKGDTQTGTPKFTEGTGTIPSEGAYSLIDAEGNPVTKLTIPGEGTYTINPDTGEVTFVPEPDFVGEATTVRVRVTDELGETADGFYTPTVVDNAEEKTVNKTVQHLYDDGTPVTDEAGNPVVSTQTLTFSRTGKVDPDTGEVTWDNWEEQTFDDVDALDKPGYSVSKAKSTGESVTPDDGDVTDTIIYRKKTYSVTYTNGDNGKSDGAGNEGATPYGDMVSGGNGVTPDSGYRFTGTYTYTITLDDGTVVTGETDDPTSVEVTGDVVFTPVYEKLPTATWVDPATGRTIKVTTPFNEDGTEPAAPENPTREGYTFDGWDRSVDAEGNVTYTAKWKPVEQTDPEPPAEQTYWVIYVDPDGQTIYLERTTQPVGNDEPAAPAAPTREGYTFDGWDRTVDEDGNITYIARWRQVNTPAPDPEPDPDPAPDPDPDPEPDPAPAPAPQPTPTPQPRAAASTQTPTVASTPAAATPKTADTAPIGMLTTLALASAVTLMTALTARRRSAYKHIATGKHVK